MKWGQNQPKTTFPIFYMYNESICVIWQKSLKKAGRFRFFQKMGKHRIQVLRLSPKDLYGPVQSYEVLYDLLQSCMDPKCHV